MSHVFHFVSTWRYHFAFTICNIYNKTSQQRTSVNAKIVHMHLMVLIRYNSQPKCNFVNGGEMRRYKHYDPSTVNFMTIDTAPIAQCLHISVISCLFGRIFIIARSFRIQSVPLFERIRTTRKRIYTKQEMFHAKAHLIGFKAIIYSLVYLRYGSICTIVFLHS